MQGKESLHEAEKKLFCSAPRFAQFVRNGNYKEAGAIMTTVASAFATLAFVKEANFTAVVAELSEVLDLIDEAWTAVDRGVSEAALTAYAEVVRIMPDAHMRVEALLLGGAVDTDPGTRGNDKTTLIQAAQQSVAALGVA